MTSPSDRPALLLDLILKRMDVPAVVRIDGKRVVARVEAGERP